MTFLGVLLDGKHHILVVPAEKRTKALNLLNWAISKKKVTINFSQQLTGKLNFFNRAIVPGRAFMRGMYVKLKLTNGKGCPIKQYHHVLLKQQFLEDYAMWKTFLQSGQMQHCRPFVDLDNRSHNACLLSLFSELELGMGVVFIEKGIWLVQ